MLLTPFFSTPSTESIIFPAQCQETAPISQLPDCFRIHCRSISGKPEYFLLSFSLCLRMLPQFRYYYQHNDHDYTDHKADRKHQTDRPCQFLCCFFLLFQGFSEQMMFYEFHWNIEDKSDSETNDERKEKAKQNSDSADDYVQVLDTQI